MKLNKLWEQSKTYNEFLEKFKTNNNQLITIERLQGSALSFFISSLILKKALGQAMLLVVKNISDALHLYQDILSFTNMPEDSNIFIFPQHEVLPYEDLPNDVNIEKQRIRVLSVLSHFKRGKYKKYNPSFPIIIITTYRAMLTKIMPDSQFYELHLNLKQGSQLKIDYFLDYLITQGYHSTGLIELPGQFSQRGGIIDLYPLSEENPLRIEMDGDKIASLRFFNTESQRSIRRVEQVTLLPKREFNTGSTDKDSTLNSLFQYLPEQTDLFIEQVSNLEKNILGFEEETNKLFLLKKEKNNDILAPDHFYLNWKQVNRLIYQKRRLVSIESWLAEKDNIPENNNNQNHSKFTIVSEQAENYFGNLELFFKGIKKRQQEKLNILILTTNNSRTSRLAEIFEDRGFLDFQLISLPEADLIPGKVSLSYGLVNYGFTIPELNLSVITEQEIFGKQRDKSYKTKRFQGKPFYQLDELKPGDFIVHINHGIGKFAGIKSRNTDGVRKDYILIQYASEDELYVPVEQLSLVHRYIGVGGNLPKLNRLTDSSWKITKKKVKESVQKVAIELFDLYKKRNSTPGFSFSSDTVWQQELEMAFPFQETEDQEKAFQDVKKDMESAQPMERLICGDVGYGKTEIAIRAAFKAVMDDKQVAVLAPTTILAQQHWENFSERMKTFPVRIEMLSRFRTRKEQQEIIADLKKGNIDIVIGTHRLVQKDIVFKDLGLLVVDEEQRFGVNHKERIKKLREQVDSLTLTATPIPRTMYLSLTGIREMSIINSPPELRLPIITFFKPKSDNAIKEAIKRELERGGQVYYVHNKVQDIEEVAQRLNFLVPEARVVVAHGQMAEDQLETIMVEFLNKKFDVLICTTIIEIGLDIPNVNTIIIDDAHKFGLSQLYQLRGRVGRSNRRAYAYLFYPSQKGISENARKRLDAIREFSDLGSGFRLAMRDLEIRGAGNLLGKEQHGFVSDVGFSYYCHLLEESVNSIIHQDSGVHKEQESEPEIEVKVDSFIPEFYINDSELRISYYQRLSQIKAMSELKDIEKELLDVYGPYPEEIANLLRVITLKIKLKNRGVSNINISNRFISIKYQSGTLFESNINNLPNYIFRKNVNIYPRGRHHELRFVPEKINNSNGSDNILKQFLSFLQQVLPSDG